jgi:hypothetical protein
MKSLDRIVIFTIGIALGMTDMAFAPSIIVTLTGSWHRLTASQCSM